MTASNGAVLSVGHPPFGSLSNESLLSHVDARVRVYRACSGTCEYMCMCLSKPEVKIGHLSSGATHLLIAVVVFSETESLTDLHFAK